MTDSTPLPPLGEWRPTRDALQAYAKVLGAIRRQANAAHPRWWHVSLQPTARGLTTGRLGEPPRGIEIELDLTAHQALLQIEDDVALTRDLGSVSATTLGEELLAALRDAGLEVAPEPERWRDDATPSYDSDRGAAYLAALTTVHRVFSETREALPGERSPVQLWPHHFDLSLEWFSDRTVRHEENGETVESPAQIGYGFSTGDEGHPAAYFYANPWEFDPSLLDHELPGRARWYTETWQGALFPYTEVTDAAELATYMRRVFEVAEPTLRGCGPSRIPSPD